MSLLSSAPIEILVYVALASAVIVSFWSSLVEATYLTLRPFSLSSLIKDGSPRAVNALAIVNEKTRLVSVTTFTDTIASVVIATSMGLILSEIFGPIGWVYSTVFGSVAIMILLYLLPKAIGIENALHVSMYLAPSTRTFLFVLSPIALPLTSVARTLSKKLVGKPTYRQIDFVSEFEDVVNILEKAGHIEPDTGRLIKTALASSRRIASDVLTPLEEVLSIPKSATILDAVKAMGMSNHPRMPVFDAEKNQYIGTVTFRSMSKAISRELLDSDILDYIVQPAKVEHEDTLATVMEKMQEAGTTICFVYDQGKMLGLITLSAIIEEVMGLKI